MYPIKFHCGMIISYMSVKYALVFFISGITIISDPPNVEINISKIISIFGGRIMIMTIPIVTLCLGVYLMYKAIYLK